ncbi:MAG TPA: TOBE domain-containing protein [Geobacteraceae bacterium]|nr:TOBE domain-containing protein [Geobacteraceae bacterium]
MRTSKKRIEVSGTLSFKKTDMDFLRGDRIALLEKIDECGSINKAAKLVGMSYKTAWDSINAMNNLSENPLFIRTAGGKSGGGTTLTEEGKELVRKYRLIQREHEKFLANLEDKMLDVDIHNLYRFFEKVSMKVSARNAFIGKVVKIVRGEIKSEVTMTIQGGGHIIAIITNESIESLGLHEGSFAYAVIKANSVIIASGDCDLRVSISNKLPGKIINLARHVVTTDVIVELSGGNTISAVIPNECAESLELKEDDRVYAMFNAASVILGTD